MSNNQFQNGDAMVEPMPEYLTPADAAKILDISAAGVVVAANSGRIRVAARTPNGTRLFLRSDVEQARQSRAQARR